jgi:hypothetical protein
MNVEVQEHLKERTTITVENTGGVDIEGPLGRDANGKRLQLTLKPGDNKLPMHYWHVFGRDPKLADAIATGKLRAVCREHRWVEVTQPLAAQFGLPDTYVKCQFCPMKPEMMTAEPIAS